MRTSKQLFHGLSIIVGAALSGCIMTPLQPDLPPLSQLAVRAIQTRTYAGQDARTVLRVVLNVLQDDGFLVHYGSTELGLLDASKTITEFDVGAFTLPLNVLVGGRAIVATVGTIGATANVSAFGDRTKVRINFERKLTDSAGRVIRVAQVTDPKVYQEFLAKLDKGLFLQQEGL
jgi:hypothetical protein